MEEVYRSSEEVKEVLATTFELHDQALIAKGREEEREQSKRKIVLATAQRGFAYELIADLVELTLAEVQWIAENAARSPAENKDLSQ